MKSPNKPKPLPELPAKDIARFWNLVDRKGPDECWLWKASTFRDGYGQFKAQGRNLKTHRIAYFLHRGEDLDELLGCHSCDNPRCCNGSHIFAGTEGDNVRDCKAKGRLNTASGESHGSRTKPESRARGERVAGARLTAGDALWIRWLYSHCKMSQQAIADGFRVSRENVSRIIRGKNWAHVISAGEPLSLSDPSRRITQGEDHSTAKLTAESVREIRRRVADGESRKNLAVEFGVTVGAIHHIIRRVSWKNL